MSRFTAYALVAALALPVATAARDRDYDDDDWGYIDPPGRGSGGEVTVDMAGPGGSVTLDTFEENLAPHGEWVVAPGYGRVWRPMHVGAGWRPYYEGRWEWTDEGWLWVSPEPWGWATYHYGRWAFEPRFGWVWIPGYQWAPAWVSWRYGPEFVGWAPLGPGLTVYTTTYPVHYDHWVFVPCNRFVGVPVASVAYVGAGRVGHVWAGTQPAPPRAHVLGAPAPAWGGPARPFIEQSVGRPVAPVRVQPVASPHAVAAAPTRAGVVPVFRPEAVRHPGAPTAPHGGIAAVAPTRGGAAVAPPRSGAALDPPPSAVPHGSAPAASGPRGQWGTTAPERPHRDSPVMHRDPAAQGGPAAPHPQPVAPRSDRAMGGGAVAAPPRGPAPARVAPPAPAPVPAQRAAPSQGAPRGTGGAPAPQHERGGFAPAQPRGGGEPHGVRGNGGGGGGRVAMAGRHARR